MILGISTGCCFDLGLTRIESLRFLKQFEIDAIELMFAKPQDIFDFKPTREDIAFLRSKKYVSFHAPFIDADYKNNAETKKIFSGLDSLALKVNARNIVFHVNCIKDFSLFENVDFFPLVENLNFREDAERLVTVKHFQDFFSVHKKFGFCLDIGHSFKQGIAPTEFLGLGEKLKQAHIHFLHLKKGELKPHGLPSKTEQKFLESARPILSLGIPLIIEADFCPEDKDFIPTEIKLLRELEKR